jgi:Fibronectin type III domain
MLRISPIVKFPALVALFALSTLLAGCSDSDDTASAPASATSATPKVTDTVTSTPTATVTSTATGGSSNGAATLSWVPPTENTNGQSVSDLAGYYIYYGTDESDLSQIVSVAGADTTTYVVSGLASGTYYFAVRAYNTMGVDSAQSDIASVTI